MISISAIALLAILLQSPGVPPSISSQQLTDLKARAESGDAKAQVGLGIVFASGDGVRADDNEAVKWFHKAADQGDAAGEYSLAEMSLTGRGTAVDVAEAMKWMRRSAEHGDPRAQFNLAVIHAQGQGVPKDNQEAAKWMRKAADQGIAAGQFGLASMYAHGEGVPQSASETARWYRSAAAQGDAASMNNLAFLLATSTEANVRNPTEAIAVGQKAVEIDASNATFRDTLATAYFEAGRFDKAVETEIRALALKPNNPSYKIALLKFQAALSRAPKP